MLAEQGDTLACEFCNDAGEFGGRPDRRKRLRFACKGQATRASKLPENATRGRPKAIIPPPGS